MGTYDFIAYSFSRHIFTYMPSEFVLLAYIPPHALLLLPIRLLYLEGIVIHETSYFKDKLSFKYGFRVCLCLQPFL